MDHLLQQCSVGRRQLTKEIGVLGMSCELAQVHPANFARSNFTLFPLWSIYITLARGGGMGSRSGIEY